MKKMRIIIPIVLILCIVLALVVIACKPKKNTPKDNLVVGYAKFSEKFSPFFAKTAYDSDVAGMTQVGLISLDREGQVVYKGIEGEKRSYNGTEYTYKNIADTTVSEPADDGKVTYNIKIKNDLKFSDGVALTIDDVIFNMYALSDLTYEGSSTFYSMPILGMNDYRYDVVGFDGYKATVEKALEVGESGPAPSGIAADEFQKIWEFTNIAGAKFAQSIVDYVANAYVADDFAGYMGKYTPAQIKESKKLQVAYGMAIWGFGEWEMLYIADAKGTYGLESDGSYVGLLEEVAEADKKDGVTYLESEDGKFYQKVKEASTATKFYFERESEQESKIKVELYSGDRYAEDKYSGVFFDSTGKEYDLTNTFPTKEDYWKAIKAGYTVEGKFELLHILKLNDEEKADGSPNIVIDATSQFAKFKNPNGEKVDNIEGITRVNDYEINVVTTDFDASAIYKLGISVAPMHYYGDKALYDYNANKFGFTKGNLDPLRAKTTTPMGAGPYIFENFESGVITFKANEHYFKGKPKISVIQFKETEDADKIPGVEKGDFDVTDPSFNNIAVEAIKKANGGDISGSKITTSTVDNLGYGYIGINADNVKVGGDASSEASKNLRKAFATVLAYYRETAIASYYGDRASVIQYPISNTSWAAPRPADEGYGIAYSKDEAGNSIYTADMNLEEKSKAAINAAVGFLNKAGFIWNETDKKFTAAPTGAKLNYELIVPGDGKGDHPAFAICTESAKALKSIGITITINDPADSNVLWKKLEAGKAELWIAAWGATADPDMYQIYHSSNIVGKGGTDSNHYAIADADLDAKILDARKTADETYRKGMYFECLKIILDWGVEIPTYQRKNAVIFSTERINMATITPDITTFWGWMNDIELIELN